MARPTLVRHAEIPPRDSMVTRAGGSSRYLEGASHGLATSLYLAEVPPGLGPRVHSHPYAEIFVLHRGNARYTADETAVEAQAGDVVIIPAGAWHSFRSMGPDTLRQTVIHEAPMHEMVYRDDQATDT